MSLQAGTPDLRDEAGGLWLPWVEGQQPQIRKMRAEGGELK